VLTEALDGITKSELDARPGPNDWTAREVAHHMADSEMTSAIRLRRLLAEDEPTIAGYDQEEFARRLFYGERPIEASIEAISARAPDHGRDPRSARRGPVGASRPPHRERTVWHEDVAGGLCGPRPRARRSDPTLPRGRERER